MDICRRPCPTQGAIMNFHEQDRHSSPIACSAFCHPEPFASLKGKLREGLRMTGPVLVGTFHHRAATPPYRSLRETGSYELRKYIDCDEYKKQAIDAVKHTTMTTHKLPAIFDVRLAFDERLRQVANRGGCSNPDSQQNAEEPGNTQGYDGEEQSSNNGEQHAAQDA